MDAPIDKRLLHEMPKVPDHLSPWIHSIYVVTFDIEFGQAIEAQYPDSSETKLNDSETNNICYSSFPDSNSSTLGSTQFHFRMRISNLDTTLQRFYSYYNIQTTQALSVEQQFIYGYVHFLQRKDPKLKRGYFQKSLVILSMLPYIEFYYNVVNVIGTNYFNDEKLSSLENVFNEARRWPSLKTGEPLDLLIMGSNIAFYIPNKDDKLNSLHANLSPTSTSFANRMRLIGNKRRQRNTNTNLTISHNLGDNGQRSGYLTASIHGTPLSLLKPHHNYQTILTAFDLDLYGCFHSLIPDLQLLWEMILTCEPFFVIAHTPNVCASFVQALTSLIYPFKYNSDFRPFFTIHDPEFREYVGLKETRHNNVILGVTNPFFAKSIEHWPNVIQLLTLTSSKSSDQLSSLMSSLTSAATNSIGATYQQQHQLRIPFVDRMKFTTTSEVLKPGLSTKYKPFLHKDREFLSKILRSNKTHVHNRPNSVQTALIRRWLIELTQSFFMPLERYLTQLMPLHSKISPFKNPPELPPFDFEAFLATLDTSGPQLTTKIRGDWLGLYKKFFGCANFYSWYSERKSEIDRKLWVLHLDSFLDIDLPQTIKSKGEVEVIDMIIVLKRKLAQAISRSQDYQLSCENLDQFRFKLVELINTLPEDLRTFFLQHK